MVGGTAYRNKIRITLEKEEEATKQQQHQTSFFSYQSTQQTFSHFLRKKKKQQMELIGEVQQTEGEQNKTMSKIPNINRVYAWLHLFDPSYCKPLYVTKAKHHPHLSDSPTHQNLQTIL
ncbi:hypothetical protein V6Z11_D07G126600 [Gossypium hirsutum]